MQIYSFFKLHSVVQIWIIIYVECFINIQKIGQKIQVKAKFPQAVITNIRTLPLVFPKMFWTPAWRKTPDGCFWHYLCKTIYLCSRKVALLQFLLKCALHLSSRRLKCYHNQRNSVGTGRRNIVPGNLIMIWTLGKAWSLKKETIVVIF